jgi:carbamoyl-phosphate synthase large subunit
MPRRSDLHRVMVIGSGPIVIGQAAEFDYSGTQACRALSEEGLEVVLVNSNPATIMTDVETADRVYVEPLTREFLARIIERERPDGLLPTLGGQTGLNLAMDLAGAGVLDRFEVELLGTPLDAIRNAEDRELFRDTMIALGQPVLDSRTATTVSGALDAAEAIGYPVVVRPAFTLGGTGGGTAGEPDVLRATAGAGLLASPIRQVLVERAVIGWKEIEYEVMRDAGGTAITVCNMENVDPMGVHTGDSIVVAPSQTLSDRDYQRLRTAALRIIDGLGIAGGCNIQFALDPHSDVYYVIEVNPRVSRSSALASKATGYPIARVAAKIAVGLRLHEIPNRVTGATKAAFEPALDYVVVKIPRWPFDKFPAMDRRLGTQMKATGEVMAIGRSFPEALLKAVRSLDGAGSDLSAPGAAAWTDGELTGLIETPTDRRLFAVAEALRRNWDPAALAARSGVDPYFIEEVATIVAVERAVVEGGLGDLRPAKRLGLSDRRIAELLGVPEDDVRRRRRETGVAPVFKVVDTCAGEFPAQTPYYYSTYEEEDEVPQGQRPRVLVLGAGPIRIGQGIEFDYSTVHAVKALREAGFEAVIVNNNPETVSTDFDISDRLYFEPLTLEDVLHVIERERPLGVLVQFGGQTALNLAGGLARAGVTVLGTPVEALDISEDREKFYALLTALGIDHPEGGAVTALNQAISLIARLGTPVLIRPSYVLGGRGMEVAETAPQALEAVRRGLDAAPGYPVLIDRYLEGLEVEVDAVADGVSAFVPGVMEHVERAGIHSGDSIAVFPAQSLPEAMEQQIVATTTTLARALRVRGLLNLQFVVHEDRLHVLEANLRSSRTVPFVSKAIGMPLVQIATKVMLGDSFADLGFPGVYRPPAPHRIAVKAPVFSMEKLHAADLALGPEMKSTGEVMGVAGEARAAMYKALLASGLTLRGRSVLASVADRDKAAAGPVLAAFARLGFRILATGETAAALEASGLTVERVDALVAVEDRDVALVVNTPTRGRDPSRRGFALRRRALARRIPCVTSLDTARVIAGVMAGEAPDLSVEPLAISESGA